MNTESTRPGVAAWAVIGVGWLVMAVAVAGAVRDEVLAGNVANWVAWLLGAAVVHDAVVLPFVVLAGWLLNRALQPTWRVPVRTALVIVGVVSLTVWPVAMRWGARNDNPSILPLPVARNLAVFALAVAAVAVVSGLIRHVGTGPQEDTR